MQEQFGRYVLLERIAVGGMAEIFRAKAPGLGGFEKILAIKRLHPRYSQDEDFIEMLIDEARITVELSHTNIGQIFDLGQVEDHYFIAMEFIDGRDVYRLMRKLRDRRERMPIEAAAYIAAESCAGLDFAHRKKDNQGQPLHIVHRDVSPQNILVSFEGEVKIVDFGIAKATHRAYQTGAGIIKGKVYCMSPEQARGEVLDHRTDIFSLGIVLYEMVTGELVYRDDDDVTLLSQVRKADIQPPSTLRPEIPSRLEQIIMRSLARERGDRYPSAQHMQRDLQRFLASYDASFGRIKLSKYMRTLFDADAQPDLSAEREALALRAELSNEADSLMSIASFDDGEDRTVTEGELADASDSVDELPSDLFEIVDSAHLSVDEPEEHFSAAAGNDSIDEFFEEEPTRTFDRGSSQYDVESSPSEIRRAQRVQQPSHDAEPPLQHQAYGNAPRRAAELGPPSQQRQQSFERPPRPASEPADFQAQPTAVFDDEIYEQGPRMAARATPFEEKVRPSPSASPEQSNTGRIFRMANIDRNTLYAVAVASVVFVFVLIITTIISNDAVSPTASTTSTSGARATVQVTPTNAPLSNAGVPKVTPQRQPGTSVVLGANQPGAQPGAVPALPSRGTVRIVSQPNGARVRIDGAWVPEMTPTRQVVPAGRLVQVHVRHQKYQAYDQDIRIRAGEEVAINAVLQPLYGTLQVESVPSNALIIANGQERGRTPSTLSRLVLDAPVRIKLMKDGWKSHEEVINWDDGTDRRHREVTVTLKSLQRDPPSIARPVEKRRTKRRTRTNRARKRVRRSAPPRPAGRGRLSVVSRPWGSIYIDGRMVHPEGPLIGHQLNAGMHRVYVCFRGNQQDCTSPRRVMIKANQNTKETFSR